ncbi:MAG: SCO family protein [Thiothrix sp.]
MATQPAQLCPTSMATLKAALAQLTPAEVQQVQGLFVSVDPERDTLEHIQRYVNYFHPNMTGLKTARNRNYRKLPAVTALFLPARWKCPVPPWLTPLTIPPSFT